MAFYAEWIVVSDIAASIEYLDPNAVVQREALRLRTTAGMIEQELVSSPAVFAALQRSGAWVEAQLEGRSHVEGSSGDDRASSCDGGSQSQSSSLTSPSPTCCDPIIPNSSGARSPSSSASSSTGPSSGNHNSPSTSPNSHSMSTSGLVDAAHMVVVLTLHMRRQGYHPEDDTAFSVVLSREEKFQMLQDLR